MEKKKYFAFISYQRKDEEWAESLHKKLEHYRLPSSIRKQNTSLPKEIRPIFRDALELAGGVLSKEIETALQQSKFLIVVCSPNSAQSPWVNKEVQTFIDLGREEQIIPFIIDGTPFSNDPNTECFPPALRSLKGEKELLGININEMGRDAAAVKVVARMFGLSFDSLWQRYEREQKRKRWMIIGGALLFALVSLGIGGYIARQNKKLERANYAMQVNLSRILAEKASALVDEGDSYLARLLALEALPPNRPYTSEAEITLRKASQHESAILRGHTDRVFSAAFSPDGKRIVSASADNTIRIWDARTGKLIGNPLEGHTDGIHSAAFSPDGKRIVSASDDNTIRIWDVQTGKQIGDPLRGHTSWGVYSAAFSPDGKHIVSASIDMTIRIWDALTGKQIGSPLKGHTDGIHSAAFSPDGKRIVSASYDHTICIWDAQTGKQIGDPLKGHTDGVLSAAFSPDGKRIVSASWDNTIRIWDAQTGKQIGDPLRGHSNFVYSAAFSPDGKRVVSASLDQTIRIWDAQTGKQIGDPLKGHTYPVNSAFFSPDGKRIVSVSCFPFSDTDTSVRIWDVETERKTGQTQERPTGFMDHTLQKLIDETRERFKDRPLTDEEKKKYYLE